MTRHSKETFSQFKKKVNWDENPKILEKLGEKMKEKS